MVVISQMKIIAIFVIFLSKSFQTNADLCANTAIDSAVRVSANKYLFVFKGQEFWVLNVETSRLSKSKSMAKYFNNNGDVNPIDGSWVDTGFDSKTSNKGSIYLLRSNSVHKYDIVFENEEKFNISFVKTYVFGQFWSGFEGFNRIEAITDLNSIIDKEEDLSVVPKDLLILNSDRVAILWPEPGDQTYATRKILCARSDQPKELSIFDPNKRNDEYWTKGDPNDCNQWKGVKLTTVMDIKALAYFPTNSEVYVFSKQEFCKIKIKFSAKNLTCNKQSLKKLFGCEGIKQTPERQMGGEVEDEDNDSDIITTIITTSFDREEDSESDVKTGSDMTWVYILIIVVIIIILIVVIIAFILMSSRNKPNPQEQNNRSKYAPIVVEPVDQRYGQLDSNVNLSMKIASPSYHAIDQHMANQEMQKQIPPKTKGEPKKADAVQRKSSKSRKRSKTLSWRSPRSPMSI